MTDRPAHRRRRPASETAPPAKKFLRCPIEPEAWEMAIELLQLSPLQADIVAMLVQDASEEQIAAELGLSCQTVRAVLMDTLQHTGLRNPADLIGVVRSI